MRRLTLSFALLALACQAGPGDDGPLAEYSRRLASTDTVTRAAEVYEPTVFDTVTWSSEAHMLARGGQVFDASCSKCHGPDGTGGAVKLRGELIEGPSLRDADWSLAGWETGIRQVVFTGTVEGMPHWGLEGLKYRDVEAVAAYVNRVMRQTAPEPAYEPEPRLPTVYDLPREIAGH